NLEFYQAILGTTHPVRTFFPQWFLTGKPTLTDARGRRFLPDYVPDGVDPDELLAQRGLHGPFTTSRPTAAVDIGIYHEIMAGRGTAQELPGVLCDFAGLPAATRRELDEGVGRPALSWLSARGIDFEQGPVPIAPFAHAFNGGIIVDEHGRTTTPGLYACGELAAGPHGANRVGGHMFAVLLVLGKRAGEHAAGSATDCRRRPVPAEEVTKAAVRVAGLRRSRGVRPVIARRAVQAALSPVMIEKDDASLARAEADLNSVERDMLPNLSAAGAGDLFAALGVVNLHCVARLIVQSARLRKESRGPHYRTDFPHETTAGDMNLIWSTASGRDSSDAEPAWRPLFQGRKG
ncbi:MAG: FAD-binding protein, partial [Anaerolineae bacterium]